MHGHDDAAAGDDDASDPRRPEDKSGADDFEVPPDTVMDCCAGPPSPVPVPKS